ncbi:MAG: hypothetical protein AUK29_04590 [Nitrospirae bacterium CG2_30_53_67]|nr:MAG: hypothetical protein AUK29_04590 [Nitrospirae bacterium CG2_30_53_67]
MKFRPPKGRRNFTCEKKIRKVKDGEAVVVEAARRLEAAGIEVVMDRCIKIEYIRCGLSGRSEE